ncbi:serine--tRNA ligase, mitochondrial [Anabrus simplex]|uniref:serine--tRNA ligase, mitochondrial n=1 Tax=Anabrus simplex TaxID=316456 RepID=UPI0035A359B0
MGYVLRSCILRSSRLRKVMFPKWITGNTFASSTYTKSVTDSEIVFPEAELDFEFLCKPENKHEIEFNILHRKGVGNINKVHELYMRLKNETLSEEEKSIMLKELNDEARKIPNMSYSPLKAYGENPYILKVMNDERKFNFKPKEFNELAKSLKLIRTENLGNFTGQRSYYLLGELSELEQALIHFSLNSLLKKGFQLVSVPDILPREIIESCGMDTKGPRTQVYELDPELYDADVCLSGTSEMALAGLHMNTKFPIKDLPLKLAAVSRCYRAETSSIADERGIYRVHQFTKVEMFGVATQDQSADLLEEFREIQEQNFASLGLYIKTLDMPLCELGAPAYRKYDIEAWLPGRQMFGELSSCSNCTDYQSRRLNIKYQQKGSGDISLHAHTVNGTACAIPRMLIALFETHQQEDGTIVIPEILQPYMKGRTKISKQTGIPDMMFIKSKHWEKKQIKG